MKLFTDKRFRYGTFSTAMMLLAAALFVLVNLLAGEFNRSRDLTAEQIFSLSAQSRSFLAGLESDVVIYYLAGTGQEHFFHHIISQLLEEYAAASPHVRVETRDPMLNPALVHQLAAAAGVEGGLPELSVVAQSGGETRAVTISHMLQQEVVNWFTGETRIVGYNFEPEITRAIHFVTQGAPPVIYYVTGSGEVELQPQFVSFLEAENFIVREANLVFDVVPEDADILFIAMPSRDWTEVKARRVLDFLEDEGRAFIALSFSVEPTPNFDGVLAAYGLAQGNYLLLEGDSRQVFLDSPFWIIPTLTQHEIVADLQARNFANLVLLPTSVEILDVRRASTIIEPLWTTSRDAFARVDTEQETLARIPSDIPGPFNMAVAVTDRHFHIDTTILTHIVAVGNLAFLNAEISAFIGPGNWQFVLNSLRWLQGQPPGIWVPNRQPPGAAPLMMNDRQANVIGGVAMGGIPLVSVGLGIFVWVKRRHS